MKEFMEQEDSFSDWKKLPETEKAACERESQAAERENTEFDFYTGKKIWNQSVYNRVVERRKADGEIRNPDYFPIYRG